jgi:FkbH-like protein
MLERVADHPASGSAPRVTIQGNEATTVQAAIAELRTLLSAKDPRFISAMRSATMQASSFTEMYTLAKLRQKAFKSGFISPESTTTLRLAILGGCTLSPLSELVSHCIESVAATPLHCEMRLGDYDNYVAEISETESGLREFAPEFLLLMPSERSCKYMGSILDSREEVEKQARKFAVHILQLCETAHEGTRAEIILTNFMLPPGHDLGPFRGRAAASEWNFRKLVNLELGLNAPSYVHICDVEFLGNRHGALQCVDLRAWYESKQPYDADFLVEVAREVTQIISSLRSSPKKLIAVDLDNTLWGGTIGDDGLEGIEIGDTSPRGEAFKAFQQHLLSLSARGILLAVCSKNDYEKAIEPFEKHPEMMLRMKDFVAFKANWDPKSDNLQQIARELYLGIDRIVFVDDNPAEIEIVRQFAPEVEGILLGTDPSEHVTRLQNSRLFEALRVTNEDVERVRQYKQEQQRQSTIACTDMEAYLHSLGMTASISEFTALDVPRIAQLINKSNQFNLTTRRRTEAEVHQVMKDASRVGFTMRLSDNFGSHGVIAIVVGEVQGDCLAIDTWLMSCRVLKRQVEEEIVNEMVRIARLRNCRSIRGVYLPTPKNAMVKNIYADMGFKSVAITDGRSEFELCVEQYEPKKTAIEVQERIYDAN